MTGNKEPKPASVESGVSAEENELTECAAVSFSPVASEPFVGNVEQTAVSEIDKREKWKLNRHQSQAVVESLLLPATPNQSLKAAAKEHRKRVATR